MKFAGRKDNDATENREEYSRVERTTREREKQISCDGDSELYHHHGNETQGSEEGIASQGKDK
jgi:hypothetical protein